MERNAAERKKDDESNGDHRRRTPSCSVLPGLMPKGFAISVHSRFETTFNSANALIIAIPSSSAGELASIASAIESNWQRRRPSVEL